MTDAMTLIRALWPDSIPAAEYERLLAVIALASGVVPAVPARATPPRRSPPAPRGPAMTAHRMKLLREALQTGPKTLARLAASAGLAETSTYPYLKKLRGLERVGDKYRLPPPRASPSKGQPRPKQGERAADRIMAALSTGPATTRDLAHATSIPLGTVSGTLSVLKQRGKVLVDHPRSDNGLPSPPVYRCAS